MKKLFLIPVFIIALVIQIKAQSPQNFSYQLVVRNDVGAVLINDIVTTRISIIENTANGSIVYQETHLDTTNTYGMLHLNIGQGNPLSGNFNTINWGNSKHFLKLEIDTTAASNYVFIGISEILSAPYALYAEKAAYATDNKDKDTTNELQIIQKTGNTISLSKNGGSVTDNDNQTLSLASNQLQISNGNTVTLYTLPNTDADTLNEIQTLSKNADTLSLSKNGGSIVLSNQHSLSSTSSGTDRTINISNGNGTTFNIADNDNDSINEIQTINKTGSNISLSKNGGSVADNDVQSLSINTNALQRNINITNGTGISFSVADNDNDTVNELQSLSKTGNTITLNKNGGSITDSDNQGLTATANGTQRTIGITNNTSISIDIADTDNDTTNEKQILTKVGNTISLSKNGGSFTDSDNQDLSVSNSGSLRNISISGATGANVNVGDNDNSSGNELQFLSFSNDTLYLSKGGFVKLNIINMLQPPTVTATAATNVQSFSAQINGNVNGKGLRTYIVFEWGLSTAYGNRDTALQNPLYGAGTQAVSFLLSNLQSATNYHYRIKATNGVSYVYSNDMAFTTANSVPILTTNPVTADFCYSTIYTAECGGNISFNGGLPVTERGVCWSTNPNPTTSYNITSDSLGSGSFVSKMTGLEKGVTYYIRAYASNSLGTAYGDEIVFSKPIPPITDIDGNGYDTVHIGSQIWLKQNLNTTKYRNGNPIPNITDNTSWSNLTSGAYCNYNNDTNNAAIYGRLYNIYSVIDSRSLCPIEWHVPTDAEWTILTDYLGGESNAGIKLKETGNKHWNFTNYATNETGFTALPGGLRGNNTFNGINISGAWWGSTQTLNPYTGDYSVRQTGYTTNYFSSNSLDNDYGLSVRCLKNSIPTVSVNVYTLSSNSDSAKIKVNILSDGAENITSRGVCWSTSPNPTINLNTKTINGTGNSEFITKIEGISSGTIYYVRAYAINNSGIGYSNEILLKTPDQLTDIDGNIYGTVQIGTQIWMKQNLKTTHYKNSTSIPNVTDNTAWGALTTGAYCNYNNDTNNAAIYGRLYNWYAVNTSNLCPTGWHVSSDAELTTFTTYLGGVSIAGGKLKEAGLAHWNSPNTGATNSSGFSALPGGHCGSGGACSNIGDYGFWWSSTENSTPNAWYRYMSFNTSYTNSYDHYKTNGFSVRCLKD